MGLLGRQSFEMMVRDVDGKYSPKKLSVFATTGYDMTERTNGVAMSNVADDPKLAEMVFTDQLQDAEGDKLPSSLAFTLGQQKIVQLPVLTNGHEFKIDTEQIKQYAELNKNKELLTEKLEKTTSPPEREQLEAQIKEVESELASIPTRYFMQTKVALPDNIPFWKKMWVDSEKYQDKIDAGLYNAKDADAAIQFQSYINTTEGKKKWESLESVDDYDDALIVTYGYLPLLSNNLNLVSKFKDQNTAKISYNADGTNPAEIGQMVKIKIN
jgi:hypothetical protein